MEIKDQGIDIVTQWKSESPEIHPNVGRSQEQAALITEGAQTIENIREILSQETATRENETSTVKNVLQKPKKKPNLATRIFDRINFPRGKDKSAIISVGFAAIGIAGISLVAGRAILETALGGNIPIETAKYVSDWLYRITGLGMASMAATIIAGSFVALKEQKNKTLYGTILTVTKVAALSNKRTEGLPVKDERYLGEMHFLGKEHSWKLFPYLSSSFFNNTEAQNVRQGLVALYKLAEACSNNSPELEGINVFMGISPAVTKSLEKFGFQIFPYKDYRNGFEKILEIPIRTIDRFLSIPMRSKFKAGTSRPSQIGIVTREKLIENKENIKRLMDRLGA